MQYVKDIQFYSSWTHRYKNKFLVLLQTGSSTCKNKSFVYPFVQLIFALRCFETLLLHTNTLELLDFLR